MDAGARVDTLVVAGRWGPGSSSSTSKPSLSPVRRGPPEKGVVAGAATWRAAACSGRRENRWRKVDGWSHTYTHKKKQVFSGRKKDPAMYRAFFFFFPP